MLEPGPDPGYKLSKKNGSIYNPTKKLDQTKKSGSGYFCALGKKN